MKVQVTTLNTQGQQPFSFSKCLEVFIVTLLHEYNVNRIFSYFALLITSIKFKPYLIIYYKQCHNKATLVINISHLQKTMHKRVVTEYHQLTSRTHVHTHMHVHTHTRTRTQTHTYTHTHTLIQRYDVHI